MPKMAWTGEKREELEFLLNEGYAIRKISELMGVSPGAIYKELRDVLPREEYENRQYLKYTAKAGWEKVLERMRGKD